MTQTVVKDGSYYWLQWKHRPGVASEWLVALYVEGPGWQLPGMLYSIDVGDPHIIRIGDEVTRAA
jgi:hypothetical protein